MSSKNVPIKGSGIMRPSQARNKMLAKIHVEFARLRPDLRHSTEELRLERLAFCEQALNLRKPLDSMRRLTDGQLGRVIEVIKDKMPQGALPGCAVHHFKQKESSGPRCGVQQMGGAEIHHLAGPEQVWAITRVFDHLGWPAMACEGFIKKRFNRTSAKMLTPKQADSLLMILFTIAASDDLKAQRGTKERIPRKDIWRYIPELKRKLGIDQGNQ